MTPQEAHLLAEWRDIQAATITCPVHAAAEAIAAARADPEDGTLCAAFDLPDPDQLRQLALDLEDCHAAAIERWLNLGTGRDLLEAAADSLADRLAEHDKLGRNVHRRTVEMLQRLREAL